MEINIACPLTLLPGLDSLVVPSLSDGVRDVQDFHHPCPEGSSAEVQNGLKPWRGTLFAASNNEQRWRKPLTHSSKVLLLLHFSAQRRYEALCPSLPEQPSTTH